MQQLNYFTLAALAPLLHAEWAGGRWIGCFSQTRDELVLLAKGRHDGARALFLRVACGGDLQYVVPVRDFRRAANNVVDLFPHLEGRTIVRVFLVPGERLLSIELEGDTHIVLKLHGPRSNVLVINGSKLTHQFRNTLTETLPNLHAQWAPPASEAYFLPFLAAADNDPLKALRRAWPMLDTTLLTYAQQFLSAGKDVWKVGVRIATEAQSPPWYVRELGERGAEFHLLPPSEEARTFDDLFAALEFWLRRHLSRSALADAREAFRRELLPALHRRQGQLTSAQTSLARLATQRSAEELGHLVLANLHLIQPGAAEVAVADFYRDSQPLVIDLEPDLNPQQNAERLYRLHRDHLRRQEVLAAQQAETEDALLALLDAQQRLDACRRPAEVAQLRAQVAPLLNPAAQHDLRELPYRVFSLQGWTIWLGRNADANDRMTFGHAKKDDLWLHARDVPGSHVIIRARPGLTPPPNVQEYAAGLALWHSKNRTASLAPVSVVQRKYVRKRKGMAPGQVTLDRETVLLVPPVKPE